jgi:cytochrome b561
MKPYTTRAPFDAATRWLHWITVVLVLAQFVTIWGHENVADPNNAHLLLTWHRSLGVCVWLVTAVRLLWRLKGAFLPPFPDAMTPLHRFIAKANEFTLYALLLIQPLTGLGMSLARGRSFELFFASMPALMARDKALAIALGSAHEFAGWAILALVLLHAIAALLHHYLWRDGVLASMAPWFRRGARVQTKP